MAGKHITDRATDRDHSRSARAMRYADIERQAGDNLPRLMETYFRRAKVRKGSGRLGQFLNIERGALT